MPGWGARSAGGPAACTLHPLWFSYSYEYFCECFSLYVRAWCDLKLCDPVGFKMVEDVLKNYLRTLE